MYHKDWDGYTCYVPVSVSVEESPQSHQRPTRWTIFIYHITGIAKHQEKISRETEAHRETPVPHMQDTNQADNCANMHNRYIHRHANRLLCIHVRRCACTYMLLGDTLGVGGLLSLLTNYQTHKVSLFLVCQDRWTRTGPVACRRKERHHHKYPFVKAMSHMGMRAYRCACVWAPVNMRVGAVGRMIFPRDYGPANFSSTAAAVLSCSTSLTARRGCTEEGPSCLPAHPPTPPSHILDSEPQIPLQAQAQHPPFLRLP